MFVPQEAGDLSVSDITVVIPTSPIPSHPSDSIIRRAVAFVREQLPLSRIIITCDGTQGEEPAYKQYRDALMYHSGNVNVIGNSLHIHQSGLLTHVLGGPTPITTPLLLYLEHDWELLPNVPWPELSQLILSGEFNYIKLHATPRISPYHEHLMLERVIYQDGVPSDRYRDNVPGTAIPIIKTKQWSQNPHLASAKFYREKILPLCEGKCDFIENIVHGIVANSPWEEFRCGIFNPAGGDMMKVRHLDGKNSR